MILLDALSVEGFKGLRRLELRFPSDGAVLVEGLNEAGKSSLFESVYFALYGSPLVTETPRGGPEEAIGYGRDSCAICLAVRIGRTTLEASRIVRRGRPSQATLVVSSPDREPEVVQGVRAVNARIVEELGNLDGDALLNSCFVEQKKLSKLEDLTAERRRESLLRLLNLERLGDLESSLRPTRADDQELARARRRSELADARAEAPRLRAEQAEAERSLLALAVRESLAELTQHEATARDASAARATAEARAPQVEALSRKTSIAMEEDEARRIEDALAEGEQRLRAAERRLAAAKEVSQGFKVSDALAQWIRLHRSVELRAHGEEDLRAAEEEVASRLAEHKVAMTGAARGRTALTILSALCLSALVVAGLGLAIDRADLVLASLLVAIGLGIVAWRQYDALQAATTAALVAESTLTEARVKAQTIHGQRVTAVNLLGGADELARCEANLTALGEEIPQDEESARHRHDEVERRLVMLDPYTVVSAEREAQRALDAIRRERDPLAARIALLRADGAPLGESERSALADEIAASERELGLAHTVDGDRLALLSTAAASLQAAIGEATERERTALERGQEAEGRARRSLGALTGSSGDWPGELSLPSVGLACPLVTEVADVSASEVEARRDRLRAERVAAEREAERLSAELGIDGADLDPDECRSQVARLERQAEVRRQAAEIVAEARRRMVARVLPNTERNFRLLLPGLTAGRYRDARITDDHRIAVWDEAAGRYVAKSIFSGGARDQFSLALRLAFALATLPEELGTSPGFLFLDEPLSSFDGQRTQALVDLLTRGEVAASFRQFFVISHSRSFDASAFRYRLVLADGAVAESSLPPFGAS